jgi:DNA-binding SARP family transcriptional activator
VSPHVTSCGAAAALGKTTTNDAAHTATTPRLLNAIALRLSLYIVSSFRSSGGIVDGAGAEAVSKRYGPGRVVEFRILGPLEVVGDGARIDLGGAKQRATLAVLLLNANRVVSVDRLADDLYAGAAPVTALKQVQRQISELRKVLGSTSVIETRSPGYVLRLAPQQLDLTVFEHLAAEATEALAGEDTERAGDLLRQALELWRGPPLGDLAYESFAQASIERLEEIRLAALEQRIEADLALGRHRELVGELEQLAVEHPLREHFRAQLMLALYRSGRQAEALEAYRRARSALVEDFGIEPTAALQELERRILTHDRSLELQASTPRLVSPTPEEERAVLVVPGDDQRLPGSLALAEPLARLPGRELIVARLVRTERELQNAIPAVGAWREAVQARVRAAAFTTADRSADIVRLASAYDVELVLVDAPPGLGLLPFPADLAAVLERSPADVGMVVGTPEWARGAGVFVPFAGAEHDWAALEIGAWLASAVRAPLRLVGLRADPGRGERDASRLLANASLAVQRLVGLSGDPLLVDARAEALEEAIAPATVVVVGISSRWRREGVGPVRSVLIRRARPPVVLVHHGPRPGGLAPRDVRTRFSWTVEP